MTRITPSFLSLLPPVYRGDVTVDGDSEIAAFTRLLDDSREEIERDIERLYDSWFVETCSRKSLPSRAALLGQQEIPTAACHPRKWVAEQAGFAASKGIESATCKAISVLGGWPCSVDFDSAQALARINVTQIRVQHLRGANPHFALSNDYGSAFWLNPLGYDTPVFRQDGAGGVLGRDASPQDIAAHVTLFQRDETDREWRKVRLGPADLSGWEYSEPLDQGAWIDPELGRLWIGAKNLKAENLMLSFSLAAVLPETTKTRFSKTGSSRSRHHDDPFKTLKTPQTWRANIHRLVKPGFRDGFHHFTDLRSAILHSAKVSDDLHFHLLDSASHAIGEITFRDREKKCPSAPNSVRRITFTARDGERPVLRGDIVCISEGRKVKLELSDLAIDGRLGLFGNVDAILERTMLYPVSHWKRTGVPSPAILVDGQGAQDSAYLHASFSVIGAVECWNRATVSLGDAILDDPFRDAALKGSAAIFAKRSTVLGPLSGRSIAANTCAFMGSLDISGSQDLGEGWTGMKSDTQLFVSTSLSEPGFCAPDRSLVPNPLVRTAQQGDLGSTHSSHTGVREGLIREVLGLDALRNTVAPSELLPLGLPARVDFIQENGAHHS